MDAGGNGKLTFEQSPFFTVVERLEQEKLVLQGEKAMMQQAFLDAQKQIKEIGDELNVYRCVHCPLTVAGCCKKPRALFGDKIKVHEWVFWSADCVQHQYKEIGERIYIQLDYLRCTKHCFGLGSDVCCLDFDGNASGNACCRLTACLMRHQSPLLATGKAPSPRKASFGSAWLR